MNKFKTKIIIELIEKLNVEIELVDSIRQDLKTQLQKMPPRTQILGNKGDDLERSIMCLETASAELNDAVTDLAEAIK